MRMMTRSCTPSCNAHRPEGGDALARLQIELVQVRSTAAALARLCSDAERFDLLLSDCTREAEPVDAGLQLQAALDNLDNPPPLVICHAALAATLRQQRASLASQAGVFGEAVLPDELLALVLAAVKRSSAEGASGARAGPAARRETPARG